MLRTSAIAFGAYAIFLALAPLAPAQRLPVQPSPAIAKWQISGMVSDESGGIKDVWISAVGPEPIRSVKTDSQGRYRLEGTVPGLYRLRAAVRDGHPPPLPRSYRISAGAKMQNVDFRLPRGAVLAGRVLDSNGRPVPKVLVFALGTVQQAGKPSLRTNGADRTNDLGEYRVTGLAPNSYLLAALPAPGRKIERARERRTGGPSAYPVMAFYPATANSGDATAIEVADATERTGFDLTLERAATYCVRFSATPVGSAADSLAAALTLGSYSAGGLLPSGKIKPGEPSEICGLTRGDYWLQVAHIETKPLKELGLAHLPVHIVDRDVDLGSIPLTPPIEVSGHVELTPPGSSAALPSTARLRFAPVDRGYFASDLQQQTIENGKFHGRIAYPNATYQVDLMGLPDGYRLVSARQGGAMRDLNAYQPTTGELVLVVDTRGAVLQGQVSRGGGEPAPHTTVLLLSADGHSFAFADADQDGFYRFSEGFPAGRYRVVALEGLHNAERETRATAERFASKAMDVTLAEAERKRVDLQAQEVR